MARWLAKGLQMAGLVIVASMLIQGMVDATTMSNELVGAVIGTSLFYVGRVVEAATGRHR